MRIIKTIIIIIFVGLIMFGITGCWDRMEPEELGYVIAIGIDKGSGGNLSVTYQMANPQGGGGPKVGTSEKEPSDEIITLEVPHIVAGRHLLTASIPRRPNFFHVNTLIISEELAKSGQLLSALEDIIRDRQTSRSVFLITVKGKAEEFITTNKPLLETRPHKFYEFMENRWENTGLVAKPTLHYFLKQSEGKAGLFLSAYGSVEKWKTEEQEGSSSDGEEQKETQSESGNKGQGVKQSGQDQGKEEGQKETQTKPEKTGFEDDLLAGQLPKKGGNSTEIIGTAVFKNGKMIGKLTGEETRYSLLLRPEYKNFSMIVTFPDPINKDKRVVVRMKKVKDSEIGIEVKDIPLVETKIPLIVDVLGVPGQINYVTNLQNQKMLKTHIKEVLKQKIEALIKKLRQNLVVNHFYGHMKCERDLQPLQNIKNITG